MGRALGLLEACLGVGWVVGPVLAAWLNSIGGFALPFMATGIVCLVLGPLPLLVLPRGRLGAPAVVLFVVLDAH